MQQSVYAHLAILNPRAVTPVRQAKISIGR